MDRQHVKKVQVGHLTHGAHLHFFFLLYPQDLT